MSDSEVKLIKLRDPEPTHYSSDLENPMGWTLADVKARFPCCARKYDVQAPLVFHGALWSGVKGV